MKDIIGRLEKATGPDRQLDAAIGEALFGHHRIEHEAATNWDSSWSELVDGDGKPVLELLAYTASLDAALTLAPKGSSIHAHIFTHYDGAVSEVEVGAGKKGQSTIPAIAVCIAALKAREWHAARLAALSTLSHPNRGDPA